MATNARLVVSKDTHDLVTKNCVQVFKEENPKFKSMNITHEFIIRRIAEYYLEN